MTDYENVILFIEFVQAANGTMSNYMTLVFGMLVTSYLAAHRLDRIMMWLALAIYSMFALGFCNEVFQIYSDFSRLGLHIHDKGQLPGAELGWFGPVVMSDPSFLRVLPKLVLTMNLAAYVGSIFFFFRARKANSSSEVGPVEPIKVETTGETDK